MEEWSVSLSIVSRVAVEAQNLVYGVRSGLQRGGGIGRFGDVELQNCARWWRRIASL